ncbi:MAG: HD domain-containing phosphohydrolase [bacterium]|nr:HD domain-containing phosphohydrolase [bacterium]
MDSDNSFKNGHSKRTANYALLLLDCIKNDIRLDSNFGKTLEITALLHDIGMVYLPKEILSKKRRLSKKEWEKIKEHPLLGASIFENFKELREIALGIRFHHERFDGKGYPDKISKDNIPLSSRILAVCDAFDALTSNRLYRKKLGKYNAFEKIKKCSGTQFDPHVVLYLRKTLPRIDL